VIVTLGERGSLLVGDRAAEHFPPVVAPAVDPSGAGDAFIGSLAVFLAERRSLNDAIRRANELAAFTVTRHGTQSGFPSPAEARDLLAHMQAR
jgi:ribokinase